MLDALKQALVPIIITVLVTPILAAVAAAVNRYLAKLGAAADARTAQVNAERATDAASLIVAAVGQTMPLKPGAEKLAAALALAAADPAPVTEAHIEAAVADAKRYPVRGIAKDGGPFDSVRGI